MWRMFFEWHNNACYSPRVNMRAAYEHESIVRTLRVRSVPQTRYHFEIQFEELLRERVRRSQSRPHDCLRAFFMPRRGLIW